MDPVELIRQGKIKRYFRATRKLNVPGLVFHITQRAAGKEPLFVEDKDYLFMLGLLKDIVGKYSLAMYAFCLMPNHVHLLLSQSQENLYDAMRDLFSRYAMIFNKKYERKGHLFGAPYRQAVCLDDTYLLAVSLYIHLNPVRAGLALLPLSYRWTSCRLYCEDDAPESFTDPNFVLNLLSNDESEKKRMYRHLLKSSGDFEVQEILEEKDAIERLLFTLTSIFPALFKGIEKKKQIAGFSGIDLLSTDELDKMVEAMKRDHSFRKPESRRARKYLIEQLIARGYKRDEIAGRLGISRKTVYNILKSQ